MILVIDNYDSFTYNLVHLIGALGPQIEVVRNDSLTVNEALARAPDGVVLSPGPCTPTEAGICVEMASACKQAGLPVLGVCLGHQSIIQAAGGDVVGAQRLMHGRTSRVTHRDDALFADIPTSFTATRYHSLVAKAATVPDDVTVIATADDDGEIMAARWGDGPCWGVQFHPESIASEFGDVMVRNFLNATKKRAAA